LEYYEEALSLVRAIRDRGGEAVNSFNMGMVYLDLGDFSQAITCITRSVELMTAVDHPSLGMAMNALSDLQTRVTKGHISPTYKLSLKDLRFLKDETISICTTSPTKKNEWINRLKTIRIPFMTNERAWVSEIALINALIAILAGNDGTLPPANPYAGLISQIYAAIEAYHNRSDDEV
jgi:hypothetical protein